VAVPKVTPVSRPELLMVAAAVLSEDHVTEDVTSPVELLPKVAVAVYCCVTPGATVLLAGSTWSAVMDVEEGKNCPQPTAAKRLRMMKAEKALNGVVGTRIMLTLRRRRGCDKPWCREGT
jgi:hypothetical protein